MDVNLLLYIIGCLLLIAFFAGTEIAFVSANRLNIELRKKQGTFSGRILGRFFDQPSEFAGTSFIGISILIVVYALLVSRYNNGWIHFLPPIFSTFYIKMLVDVIVATAVILLAAELLPKSFFRRKAEVILSVFAIPLMLLHSILYPIGRVFISISEFILKYLFNVRIKDKKAVFARVSIDQFVKQTLHGQDVEVNELNKALFENALDLVNVKLRRCMIPRNEVIGVSINTPIEEVRSKFVGTKLSKIVVYEDNLDNILGYLHHLDLNKKPSNIKEILHTIAAVPETMSAVELMNRFTKDRKSIAWVIDEFGGTAGIVTMEDVLEKIFGDIKDEYDEEEYVEKQIADNEFIFSGRLELDYLEEKYGFDFTTTESETLSGYIISHHEAIPKNKARIIIGLYEFDILLVSDTRIETVKMKVLKPL